MQRQINDISNAFVDRLKNLQSSVDNITSPSSPDTRIEECLTLLKSLQMTPFLTAKDVKTTEGMLRHVHEL